MFITGLMSEYRVSEWCQLSKDTADHSALLGAGRVLTSPSCSSASPGAASLCRGAFDLAPAVLIKRDCVLCRGLKSRVEGEETTTTNAVDVPSVLRLFVLILFIQQDRRVHKNAASLFLPFFTFFCIFSFRLLVFFFSFFLEVSRNEQHQQQ